MKTNDEYVILNKTKLLKKKNKIQESLKVSESLRDSIRAGIEFYEIKMIDEILSESISLSVIVQKAFESGRKLTIDGFEKEDFEDYENFISELI